jgi:hypothetical protein
VVELEATVHEGGKGWGSSGGGLLPKQRKWREGGGCPARACAREGGGAWVACVMARRRWGSGVSTKPARGKAGGCRRVVVARTGEAEGGVRSGGPRLEERGGLAQRSAAWGGRYRPPADDAVARIGESGEAWPTRCGSN